MLRLFVSSQAPPESLFRGRLTRLHAQGSYSWPLCQLSKALPGGLSASTLFLAALSHAFGIHTEVQLFAASC
jgi:hypothetical protein